MTKETREHCLNIRLTLADIFKTDRFYTIGNEEFGRFGVIIKNPTDETKDLIVYVEEAPLELYNMEPEISTKMLEEKGFLTKKEDDIEAAVALVKEKLAESKKNKRQIRDK